jgi:DNA polymerase kappa
VKKYISSTDEILPVSRRCRACLTDQIAQELLRKELPLRIRLLGIRLSTLKDLTIPEKGIKAVGLRFQGLGSPAVSRLALQEAQRL